METNTPGFLFNLLTAIPTDKHFKEEKKPKQQQTKQAPNTNKNMNTKMQK